MLVNFDSRYVIFHGGHFSHKSQDIKFSTRWNAAIFFDNSFTVRFSLLGQKLCFLL